MSSTPFMKLRVELKLMQYNSSDYIVPAYMISFTVFIHTL